MAVHDVKVKVEETVKKTAEQLITENLDIWTTAIEQKSASGRGSSKKFSLHGIKKLRELILELAVRGKLVPQDENDEPASILLERIAAEKAQLVKDKKIKKPKALPEISEGEKSFELSRGWEWTQLGFLTNYGVCDKAEPHEASNDDWVLELEDVEKGTSKLLKKVRFKERTFKSSKNRFEINDVIYGKLRPYLDKVLIADEAGVCTTEMIPVRTYRDLRPDYLRLVMKSPYFIKYANESTHGMNLPRMGTDKARAALFPLAPLEEQHRIVAKVDELMSLCDALEAQTEVSLLAHQTLVETLLGALLLPSAQTENTNSENKVSDATIDITRSVNSPAQISSHEHAVDNSPAQVSSLERAVDNSAERTVANSLEQSLTNSFAMDWQRVAENFDTLFTTSASIDTLKQTILQLAVMGKLVEQDANDEPVAKLLERIAEHQAIRVKNKEIQKPKKVIIDDSPPLITPSSWLPILLNELVFVTKLAGFEYSKYIKLEDSGEVPVIRAQNVRPFKPALKSLKYISRQTSDALPRSALDRPSLLVTFIGAGIGDVCVFDKEERWHLAPNVAKIEPYADLSLKYLCVYLNSTIGRAELFKSMKSTAQPSLSMTTIREIWVSVPPLEEQHRIVAKVDELMALCHQLKARLSDAQTTQLHLTDAIVEQAI